MIHNFIDKKIILNFNWAGILAFVVFWTYSLFGAPLAIGDSLLSYIFFVVSLLVTAGIFLLFLYFLVNPELNEIYRDKIEITGKDLLIVLSYFGILFLFSFNELRQSLGGDEIVHVHDSQFHSRAIIYVLGLFFGESIGNVPFKTILWALDIIAFLFLLAGFYYLRKPNWQKVILLVLVFIGIKFAAAVVGLGYSPHPPFRFFPLWVSSSLFSSTEFAYRLPQFGGLILFMWFVQRVLSKRLPFLQSWLFALVVGTIPVLWHVGLLVEQSIWTASIWSLLLLAVILLKDEEKQSPIYWIRWFSLISIFSLMRQSAFIAFVPLGIFFLKWLYENRLNIKIRKVFFLLVPVIVMTPFIIKSILVGTPATYIPGEVDYIPAEASSLQRVIFSLTSGVAPKVILSSVMIPWVACFFFAFLPRKRRDITQAGVVLLFFAAAYFVFYSIRPVLWGIGRYQAEYIIPFAVLGLANIVLILRRYVSVSKILNPALLLGLICFNVFTFVNLPEYNVSVDERQKIAVSNYSTVILSHDFYNYKEALYAVKKMGYAGQTYIIDDYNASFNTIIYGYSVGEYERWDKNRKSITCCFQDREVPFQITRQKDIRVILIGRYDGGANRIMSILEQMGWKRWKEFRDEKYGSTIHGLIRN